MNNKNSTKDSVCSTEGTSSGSKHKNPIEGNTTHGTTSKPNNFSENQKFSSAEKGKGKAQDESIDEQLEKIEIESLKNKDNSLMGYVFGDPINFEEIKERLTSSWRLVHGEVDIYDRGHGWFECVFYKSIDNIRVWEGRPYHVRGQLVLLRPWRIDFNPEFEDTNVLDLWIRILNLSPALACNQGVKVIVEKNRVGKFIKFDHASGGQFSRVCVNMDITKGVIGDVKLSEKRDDEIPLNIWFEDFPQGCGNCGNISHVYKNCPLRKHVPKHVNITIIKRATPNPPPSQEHTPNTAATPEENQKEEEWLPAHKGRRRSRKSLPITPQGIKPYISGMGGVSITFKTVEQSVEASRMEEKNSQPNAKEKYKVVAEEEVIHGQEGEGNQQQNSPQKPVQVDMEVETEPHITVSPHDEDGEYTEAEGELEDLYESDDLIGEDLAIMEEDEAVFVVENDEVVVGEINPVLGEISSNPPIVSMNNLAIVANTITTSDSLKRKGEEDGVEDTTSSKPKRSRVNPVP